MMVVMLMGKAVTEWRSANVAWCICFTCGGTLTEVVMRVVGVK